VVGEQGRFQLADLVGNRARPLLVIGVSMAAADP